MGNSKIKIISMLDLDMFIQYFYKNPYRIYLSIKRSFIKITLSLKTV